jgi:hypothetical protein
VAHSAADTDQHVNTATPDVADSMNVDHEPGNDSAVTAAARRIVTVPAVNTENTAETQPFVESDAVVTARIQAERDITVARVTARTQVAVAYEPTVRRLVGLALAGVMATASGPGVAHAVAGVLALWR